MRVSVVCSTGSTDLNSRLRAELLWRMVNSAHNDPGLPFELILIDNSQGGAHRQAIRDIFDTYATVTHIVQNRVNEYHGGGVTQGFKLADGDMLVQITDDLELSPGWLKEMLLPLRQFPEEKLVGALLKGHNTSSSRLVKSIRMDGRNWNVLTNCSAYCWAYWRETHEKVGPWKRSHFADTRLSRRFQRTGYHFVVPEKPFATETNLNYLRPWNYKEDRGTYAAQAKAEYVDGVWRDGFYLQNPVVPTKDRPLRNPNGIGPDAYPPEWLARQEIAGDP